ncbi:hypothetical protein [Entomohabitans teleogrylli]|uniref:hypothetical protein n=1 Tax=Entomohabitans teleogrylli TaxID=1384589 RepID=UPI00073DA3DB|nr:hypothetical protein [Entomohabitans teleogrylli]
MKHYLISDNSYFLLGARTILRDNHIISETINTSRQSPRTLTRTLCQGDIVVVAVDDVYARRKLIEAASRVSCRIVFMPAFRHVTAALGDLPWVLPRQVSGDNFIQVMNRLSGQTLISWRMKDEHLFIMEILCRPDFLADLQFIKEMTTRNLSQLKRTLLKKHGLNDANCHGTLLCRDILFLRKLHQEKQKRQAASLL